MYKIIVATPSTPEQKEILRQAAEGNDIEIYDNPKDVTVEQLKEADVIVGNWPPATFTDMPKLKLLHLSSAGADNYASLPIFHQENAPKLCNCTGAFGVAIADYLVAGTVLLFRHFHHYRDYQHQHVWADPALYRAIDDSSILVLGMGNLGSTYAERVHFMGAHTIGIRRTLRNKPDCFDEQYTLAELKDVIGKVDLVVNTLPNSKESEYLFNEEMLCRMKPTAYIINVGRGNCIDNMALAKVLKEGKIAGAMLDVTDPEPLPKDHPLWDEPNCMITPHTAGGFHQYSIQKRLIQIEANNIRHFLHGEPYETEVNLETGYTKN